MCSNHATVAALLGDLGAQPGNVTIVDMEASPEHLSRGTVRSADVLLLVTEPYYRSLETVKRLAALAAELPIPQVGVVVNKVRSDASSREVAEFCERYGLERLAEIPWSDDVVAADLLGVPLLDASPDGPAVAAVKALAERLHPSVPSSLAPGGS
jgi:CO dehydrogenase maturation factor